MGRFQSLMLISVASITLAACGSTEDKMHLGSRDDIIVTNRGMPAPTSAPEAIAPMIKEEAASAVTEEITPVEEKVQEAEVTTEPTEEVIEKAVEEMESQPVAVIEEKEAVTEIVMDEPVQQVEEVAETVIEAVEAESVSQSAPMSTTAMKTEKPVEVAEVVEVPAPTEEIKEEKVEGGCYKKVVVNVDGTPELGERRIICEKDLTPSVIAIVQQALKNQGYDLGKADGKAGINTYSALEVYQRKNGLGMGGFTYETLEHLNIRIK